MGIFDAKPAKPVAEEGEQTLQEKVVGKLCQVYDPEIPVNIYELGLVYEVMVDEAARSANIDMTLTSPQCPAAQEIPLDAKYQVELLEEIDTAEVNIVWEPPWTPEKMSEEAKLELGIF